MKTLVFTSASSDMSLMLAEWAVSLRRVAGYEGDALVLDYGLTPSARDALRTWDVRTVDCKDRGSIVCTRHVDAIPHLLGEYRDHIAAHFDADVWFQSPIDGLFLMAAARSPGCVFAPDVGWFSQPFQGDARYADEYAAKVRRIRAAFGGTIQGGMACGAATALAAKFRGFEAMLREGMVKLEYGADQFALNWLFDPDADSADGHLWNCIGSDTAFADGVWYSTRGGRRERAVGLHVVGMSRNEVGRLFRNLHRDLFAGELAPAGLGVGDCAEVPTWGNGAGDGVLAALASVIATCRTHRGSALAVGMPRPHAVFADVGCTGLVPLSHGSVHYWDQLGLPRQPHVAHPERLYLSGKAVDSLADAPLDLAWDLCRQFKHRWFDFMLTMMCARLGLSWGPLWCAQ